VFELEKFVSFKNLKAFNWRSERTIKSLTLTSIPVHFNFTNKSKKINNELMQDIMRNENFDIKKDDDYYVSNVGKKDDQNLKKSFNENKKSFEEKIDNILAILEEKGESICPNIYNKIINFLYEYENEISKNKRLQKGLSTKVDEDAPYKNNNKEDILINHLTSLLEDQIKIANTINKKFIH
jgi:hypothetical protein